MSEIEEQTEGWLYHRPFTQGKFWSGLRGWRTLVGTLLLLLWLLLRTRNFAPNVSQVEGQSSYLSCVRCGARDFASCVLTNRTPIPGVAAAESSAIVLHCRIEFINYDAFEKTAITSCNWRWCLGLAQTADIKFDWTNPTSEFSNHARRRALLHSPSRLGSALVNSPLEGRIRKIVMIIVSLNRADLNGISLKQQLKRTEI